MIGIGLGENLARRAQLQWVVATDGQGTELALHGEPGQVLIYPTNAVAKRWVEFEYGFVPPFLNTMVDAIADMRENHQH